MALFSRVSTPSCVWNGRGEGKFLHCSTHSWKCRAEVERSDKASSSSSSSQSMLERLERLTQSSSSSSSSSSNTIASKLVDRYGNSEEGSDFSVPLVYSRYKKPKISVQRNIKRQEYLDKVSQRDDSGTFATIGLFVLVPPLAILAVAIAVGYVNILP
ncbi:uncharacterized protein LOC9633948 isoform X1 [Selaginella moellendorffii]|uniref:uncharacterized protein LOC9633948 isoform X1 n=1 Tax=Selaginella moellendorffii TaxID=88036 RepID=UPI000D1D112E|nr:uncharacterized protein LOC9633948 isoform X1 [Selaginella moellendorffii]|eukprot:XP_024525471.1 uncharacterized protein LOC9633948 isoform X1 [Selaginella moellendorffii]